MRAVLLTILAVLMFTAVLPGAGYATEDQVTWDEIIGEVGQILAKRKWDYNKFDNKRLTSRGKLIGIQEALFPDSVNLIFGNSDGNSAACVVSKNILPKLEIGKQYTYTGKITLIYPVPGKDGEQSHAAVFLIKASIPELGEANKYGPLTLAMINIGLDKIKELGGDDYKEALKMYSRHIFGRPIKFTGRVSRLIVKKDGWQILAITPSVTDFEVQSYVPINKLNQFKEKTSFCGLTGNLDTSKKPVELFVAIYNEKTGLPFCKGE